MQKNLIRMQKDISTVHGSNDFISLNGFQFTSLYASFSPCPSLSHSRSGFSNGDRTTTTTPFSSSDISNTHALIITSASLTFAKPRKKLKRFVTITPHSMSLTEI